MLYRLQVDRKVPQGRDWVRLKMEQQIRGTAANAKGGGEMVVKVMDITEEIY